MNKPSFKIFLAAALFVVSISFTFSFAESLLTSSRPYPYPTPPSPPYLYKPTDPNFDGTYFVRWSVVECATHYELQEADNPGFSNAVSYAANSVTQRLLTKTITATYYYRVRVTAPVYQNMSGNSFLDRCFSRLKDFFTESVYAAAPCSGILFHTNWSNVQSITIAEPTSFIDGIVYDAAGELPLQDAQITSADFPGSVNSGSDGKFSFSFQTFFPESGKLTVTVNIHKSGFTSAQRTTEVVAVQHAAVDSVYLTALDPVTTTIPPEGGTHTNSTGEIELIFPPGAVTEPTEVNSTKYQKGKDLPNELPGTTFFTYALNLEAQTAGSKQKVTTFNQPVTMRLANTLGFAPGTPIPAGV
ncbi:MAG: hypothetical protein ABH845_03840, partial [Candidatus Omnitrophota bacterium]